MKMLEGVRVLDLTMWAFCPSAGAVLAEWGADVIHIENAKSPDPLRTLGGAGTLEPGGAHWMFNHYNRGKRAMALDLANDQAREALYALVRESDVFLTSFLPNTRRKLGFDVDQLREINPNLIYAKGTGAGPLGSESHRGGYDGATWWHRGSLASSVMNVTQTTQPSGMVGHGDGMSGLVLAGGIVAALFKRERSGEVVVVDSSLLGTAAWFNAPAIIGKAVDGHKATMGQYFPREMGQWSGTTYRTADDRFIGLLHLGDHQNEFENLCENLDRMDLVADPRFASPMDRMTNSAALMSIMDDIFATKPLTEWKSILLTSKGVWAPVQTVEEMPEDTQVQANRMIRTATYGGRVQPIVMPPVMFNEDAGPCDPAPDFNQHTDEVLRDIAGYDSARIAALRDSGAIV
ncbi:MAG: CaiB/BaiF CoA-transferase family protein [Actinomycetota bacterium]|nr:CaiB/BaiF CoA-transferase family protein [Actinomycetota bacterium]